MYAEELICHFLDKERPEDNETKNAVLSALKSTGMLSGITEIQHYDGGMTNHQYRFKYEEQLYLLRIPGEGSSRLVDRKNEASVYASLKGKRITDEVLYMNAQTGIKIARYMQNVHACAADNAVEARRCMVHLRHFHEMDIQMDHEFNVFSQIEEYEAECYKVGVSMERYRKMKSAVLKLQQYVTDSSKQICLCHIDSIADNFLLDHETVYLIDWEYAAMCDPHIDIAMFCIYEGFEKKKADRIIDAYFEEGCPEKVRKKIYAYMSMCAYLWVLWSEIKEAAGTDFTEYKEKQLHLAVTYFRLLQEPEKESDVHRERKEN